MATDNMINLGINPELVKPIIENQIKAAVCAALGGEEKLIDGILSNMMSQKVDSRGNVTKESYNQVTTWFEWAVTNQIKEAIQEELKAQIASMSSVIRKSIIKKLRTEQGASIVADAILNGLNGTFERGYNSKIEVKFERRNDYDD